MRGSSVFSRVLLGRSFLAGALAACAIGGAAHAENLDRSNAAIGVGMICNSQAQAARFVALRATGADAKRAMTVVNKEAKDPRACGVAAIAFTRDATLDFKPVNNTLVQVVRISVVAGFNGNGWQSVSNLVQYAVMEGEGETI